MTDILDRLKHWASIQADGSQLGADLREAVVEMERLQRLAGAVSDGPSFADVYRRKSGSRTEVAADTANEPSS